MAMTRKILLSLLLVLALAGGSLAPAAGARTAVPPGFFGISPQSAGSASDFELMREAGVTSVRLPLFWFLIQNKSPRLARPDWSGFDREVELAAEAELAVFPFVWGSPAWISPDPYGLPVRGWQRAAYGRLLNEAVRRYGPGGSFWRAHSQLPYEPVRTWEIWNEENIVTFSTPPSPTAFAALIRTAGRVLHRADRGARVLLGGFFGRPLQIPPNVASGDFLARLYRAGNVKRYFDGVALHPYVADYRAMGAQIRNLRRIMRNHHDGATPLYVTELGWGSRNGPTRWERGLWGQANELSRSFAMLANHRRSWRIGGAWWFTWSDEGGNCLFCRSAGLLTAHREAKPAWYRFNAWTGGDAETVPKARFGDEADAAEEARLLGE